MGERTLAMAKGLHTSQETARRRLKTTKLFLDYRGFGASLADATGENQLPPLAFPNPPYLSLSLARAGFELSFVDLWARIKNCGQETPSSLVLLIP
jgi:hypothetical protein